MKKHKETIAYLFNPKNEGNDKKDCRQYISLPLSFLDDLILYKNNLRKQFKDFTEEDFLILQEVLLKVPRLRIKAGEEFDIRLFKELENK